MTFAEVSDPTFDSITLAELEMMARADRDQFPFGVVGVDAGGVTHIYNTCEARMAGLHPEAVIGISFFDTVAQCMNNFMVAQRLATDPRRDHTLCAHAAHAPEAGSLAAAG